MYMTKDERMECDFVFDNNHLDLITHHLKVNIKMTWDVSEALNRQRSIISPMAKLNTSHNM